MPATQAEAPLPHGSDIKERIATTLARAAFLENEAGVTLSSYASAREQLRQTAADYTASGAGQTWLSNLLAALSDGPDEHEQLRAQGLGLLDCLSALRSQLDEHHQKMDAVMSELYECLKDMAILEVRADDEAGGCKSAITDGLASLRDLQWQIQGTRADHDGTQQLAATFRH